MASSKFIPACWFCASVAMLTGGHAHADLIIDTGDGGTGGGHALSAGQWLAAEITLTQVVTVTGIETWMFEQNPGDITIAIYEGGGMTPSAIELFSITFYADPPTESAVWYGVHGLDWNIGPGTYWVNFEVRSGDADFGLAPPVPYPLSNYAFTNTANGLGMWFSGPLDFGLRVYGDTESAPPLVPEPASLSILGLGILALASRVHRTRKAR